MGRDAPSIGVWVNLLQDYYGIGIFYEKVRFLLGSGLGSPLGGLLDYDTWPPIGIQFIVDIPPGSKILHPDLEGSLSGTKLAVHPSWYCSKVPPPPSRTCPTYPSQSALSVTLSMAWPNLSQQTYMGIACSPLPQNNDNLPLPFFGVNHTIVFLNNMY